MPDLRCPHKMFGELVDGHLDVKCSSVFCGAGPGVVVIHRFDPLTGELTDTRRFRDPGTKPLKEGRNNGTEHHPASVRHS
jgi:hypothetical protein